MAEVPPTEAMERASGRDSRANARVPADTWDVLGKVVLPASVACYFIGFLVAVPHFARCGVPVDVISLQTFLAAGILFLVLTVAAGMSGIAVRETVPSRSGPRWKAILSGLAYFLLPLALVQALSAGWGGTAYVAYVGVLSLTFPSDMRFSLQAPHLFTTAWNVIRVMLVGLPGVGFFAVAVYPSVPVQFGGGRPPVLLQLPTAGPGVIDHDRWALVGCRGTPAGPQPSCRTVYKIHDGSANLFVAYLDTPGTCPSEPIQWNSWGLFAHRRGCFQRIANSEIARLEGSGHP